jgi:hypothetical protein
MSPGLCPHSALLFMKPRPYPNPSAIETCDFMNVNTQHAASADGRSYSPKTPPQPRLADGGASRRTDEPGEVTDGKVLKLSSAPPRFIVELYFRVPFTAETTNHAMHSVESSVHSAGYAREKRAENATFRCTTPLTPFHGKSTTHETYRATPAETSSLSNTIPAGVRTPGLENARHIKMYLLTSTKVLAYLSSTKVQILIRRHCRRSERKCTQERARNASHKNALRICTFVLVLIKQVN